MAQKGPKGLLPLIITMIVSSLIFAACNKNEGSMPKTGSEKQAAAPATEPSAAAGSGTSGQASAALQAERDAFLQTARTDMDQLKGRIAELKSKAQHSSTDIKARLDKEIPDLETQLQTMEKKFDELKNASAASWQQMKTAFSASIENLKSALNKSGNA